MSGIRKTALLAALCVCLSSCTQQAPPAEPEEPPEPEVVEVDTSADEELIRDGLDSMLGVFEDPSPKALSAMVSSWDSESLSEVTSYGIDASQLLACLFDSFEYEIGDVQVSGDYALADVHLKTVNLELAWQSMSAKLQDEGFRERLRQLYLDGDDTGKLAYVHDEIARVVNSTGERIETTLTMRAHRTNYQWQFTSQSMRLLIEAMGGNFTAYVWPE